MNDATTGLYRASELGKGAQTKVMGVVPTDGEVVQLQTLLAASSHRLDCEVHSGGYGLSQVPAQVSQWRPGGGILVIAAEAVADVASRLTDTPWSEQPEVIVWGRTPPGQREALEGTWPSAREIDRGSAEALDAALGEVLRVRLPVRTFVEQVVGQADLPTVISLVRRQMVFAALDRAGTKRASAKLLGVTRPAVQQILKRIRATELPELGKTVDQSSR